MKLFLIALPLLFLLSGDTVAAEKPTVTHMTLMPKPRPTVIVVALSNKPGIPKGWYDSTTRTEVTEICREMIANQSELYANAISKSRCIIQVQE